MTKARENPFSTDRVLAVRYRPMGWTWEQAMAQLAKLNYRAAIVGPQGTGKTTLLEDLAPRLCAAGFSIKLVRLDSEHRTFDRGFVAAFIATLEPTDIVLLDGCEQMSWWRWKRFELRSRKAAGLIITTHQAGRLPTLVECATSPTLLADIIATLAPGESPDTHALFDHHGGNMRSALRELYDRWAAIE